MNTLDKATEPRDLTGYSPKGLDTVIKSGPFPGHPARRVPVGPNVVNVANRSVASSQNQAEYASKRLRQKPAPSGNVGPAILKTNGVINTDQAILNLQAGTNITLTADSVGDVLITASGGGGTGGGLPLVSPLIPPVAADFTHVNPSTAVYTNTPKYMNILSSLLGGDNVNCNSKAIIAPGGGGISSVIAGFLFGPSFSNSDTGIFFRESATGKLVLFHQIAGGGGNLVVTYFTNPTTFSGNIFGQTLAYYTGLLWLRLEYDGTNISFFITPDGINFFQFYSQPKATFFTVGPDEWGFYSSANNTTWPGMITMFHWNEQGL